MTSKNTAVIGRKIYDNYNGNWINTGAYNKYSTPITDSDGYVVLTYDSDFDLVEKALTPIINFPATDSDGNSIVWNPTIIKNEGHIRSDLITITPSSGSNSYTLSPLKTDDEHSKTNQIIVFRSTTLPAFTYDSAALSAIKVTEIKTGNESLEYIVTYDYEACQVEKANVPDHMFATSMSVGVPAIEFLKEDNITLPNDIQGIHVDSTQTNLYFGRTGSIEHRHLSTASDVSTFETSFDTFTPYSYHTTSIRDVELSDDGSKMFVLSETDNKIIQYDLDSAYHPTQTSTRLFINEFENSNIGEQMEVSYDGKFLFSKEGTFLSTWELFDGDSTRDLYNISTFKDNSYVRKRVFSLPTHFQSYRVNGYPNATARSRGARSIIRFVSTGFSFRYIYQHIYEHTSQPRAFCFNRDGTNLWSATNVTASVGEITEYTMTDPFDTSTIYQSRSRNHTIGFVTGLDWERPGNNSIQKMAWSADGYKFFVLDTFSHSLYQFNASTPFRINTIGTSTSADLRPLAAALYPQGGYSQIKQLTEIPTVSPTNAGYGGVYGENHRSNMKNFFFNDDGTQLRVTNDDDIFEYTLSSPFDLSNVTYDGANTDFSYRSGSKYQNYLDVNASVWMADSDKKFYLSKNNIIYMFNLDSGLSSADDPYTQRELDLNSLIGQSNFTGMYFNDSGHTLYLACRNNNNIYKLNLDSAYDLRNVSYVSMYDTPSLVTDLQGIVTSKDETRMHLVNGNDRKIYQIDIDSNFESSQYNNISYVTVNPGNSRLTDMFWNKDGSEFSVVGNSKVDTYITENNYQIIPL